MKFVNPNIIESPIAPATPDSGIVLFSTKKAGIRQSLAVIDNNGSISKLQVSFDDWRIAIHETSPNNSSFSSLGISGSGFTILTSIVVTGVSSTSFKNTYKRVVLNSSAATAGLSAGLRYASGRFLWRGNATGLGGFYFSIDFAFPSSLPAGYLFFAGLIESTAAISSTAATSTIVSCIGVGKDTGDTNLFFMYNDSAGVCTRIDTGITPTSTTVYRVRVYCLPNDSVMYLSIEDLETNIETVTVASTNIPVNTAFFSPHLNLSNNTTAQTASIEYARTYIVSPT